MSYLRGDCILNRNNGESNENVYRKIGISVKFVESSFKIF